MNEIIKQMIEDGFSKKHIQFELKLTKEELDKIVTENNFEMKKELFSKDKIEHIVNLYNQGVSFKTLGTKYSIAKLRIEKWVEESGIKRRSKEDSHRYHFFNQNKLDVIDTEEKAYWLGFFYADAYNCETAGTVNISLKINDFDHLKKCEKFFEFEHDVVTKGFGKYTNRNTLEKGVKEISIIRLYSKHLCLKLNELGCPQAKKFYYKISTFFTTRIE